MLTFHLAMVALANMCSVMCSRNTRGVVANAILVVTWAFGGLSPSYAQIKSRLGFIGIVLYNISAFQYAMKLQVVIEITKYSPALLELGGSAMLTLMHTSLKQKSALALSLAAYALIVSGLTLLFLIGSRNHFEGFWKFVAWAKERSTAMRNTAQRVAKKDVKAKDIELEPSRGFTAFV
jgi:hypothetical protein